MINSELVAGEQEFAGIYDRYRTELFAHCYRMLGSVHDAEDLVQETYLRAWRSYDSFEGRASLRTWLYRIATNACLTALDHRDRRLLPSGLGAPTDVPGAALGAAAPEIPWLQPAPDTLLVPVPADPAAVVAERGSFRLALIAALQCLPPRQRAVLILRDVLAMPAGDVADMLGTSVAAVKSALQRARGRLESLAPVEDEIADNVEADQRDLLNRYVRAFEDADITGLLTLLADDAAAEMPPYATWVAGREAIGAFFGTHVFTEPGRLRLVPTRANGQPAFGLYARGADGRHHPHSVTVLTLARGRVSRIHGFLDPNLLGLFGLAPTYDEQIAAPVTP